MSGDPDKLETTLEVNVEYWYVPKCNLQLHKYNI